MDKLKDHNQKMAVDFEQLQRDHNKLKEDEQRKSIKLQEFQLLNEQAKQNPKGNKQQINYYVWKTQKLLSKCLSPK